MDFDVFISHSSKDKQVANQACATLERSGLRCWIAPRDIRPGDEYGAAIVHAIDRCRAMVLIFSSNANASRQIPREVERAVAVGVPILPVRIEDVVPRDSLAYFVDSVHWLDAITPPLEDHLQRLADSANRLLQSADPAGEARPDPSPRRLWTPVAMRFDRAGSPIWPAVGKFAAMSLIVCAGLLAVTFAASRWFGSKAGPPVAAVAERAVDVPAKMAAETPAKTPAAQGASQIVEASKADMPHATVDQPVVKEASRSIGNGAADTPPPDAPKAGSVVAVAKDVVPPETPPPSPGAPPSSSVLSSGGKASPHFTAEDAGRVAQLAAEKKFPLPKYQIEDIAPHVPAKYRRYVGIWASRIGFNGGSGREGIIILSDVDAQGVVTGVYAVGPPTPKSYEPSPAWFRQISGKIKDDVLSFALGSAAATVRFSPPNALFIDWTFSAGRSATDVFYPVWMLSEHEGASSVAQTRKPN